jgi:predicted RNase H-like HicB family nuclease
LPQVVDNQDALACDRRLAGTNGVREQSLTFSRWEYSREEIPALFGLEFSTAVWNVGFVKRNKHILLLTTLDKAGHGSEFQYKDHFVSPVEFGWQSQNRTSQASADGQDMMTTDDFEARYNSREGLRGSNMREISFNVHVFREGLVFVAHVPELDVSSCGDTADDARRNIKDAVRGFLETAEEMGTLSDVLQEAGYRQVGDGWSAPEFVSLDRMAVGI